MCFCVFIDHVPVMDPIHIRRWGFVGFNILKKIFALWKQVTFNRQLTISNRQEFNLPIVDCLLPIDLAA
jgi:hypothetical protein